jgi:hypothetical protein
MFNAYELTIAKLQGAMAILNRCVGENELENAICAVKEFKHYADCFYCQKYRTIMQGHSTGCCKNCLLHKYGEKMAGREISYNGCYKIPCYREVVRLSWEFCAAPNVDLAKLLIKNMEECINQLKLHKDEVKD